MLFTPSGDRRPSSQRRAGLFRSLAFSVFVALLTSVSLASAPPAEAATKQRAKAAKPVRAKVDPNRPPASARPIYESIVIDAASGSVLHQVNADTPAYPASLTKMMTLYMLFDAMQKGKVHLDTPMKVSKHAASQAPSKLGVTQGSTIPVEPAIYALVTRSANDVAVVIAEHLGGSESRFATMMTARARAMGMTRTAFKNANGLPNRYQLSTARDMAILGRRLMLDFPQQYEYFSKTEFPYRGVMIKGHNRFMENYDGADGLKTGYTFASGFNLAASARQGDRRLITVVFGGATAKVRDDHVAALMDAGFGVLQRDPQAVQVAQSVDHFPSVPVPPAAAVPANPSLAATAQTDEDAIAALLEPVVPAGDAEDPDDVPVIVDMPAPPLAATVALVPPPGASKQAAKAKASSTTARAVAPGPSDLTAPAPTATWGIQVGAFSNRQMAQTQADAAAQKVGKTYQAATARVVPVRQKSKTLYRAQVIGLSQQDMIKACSLAGKLVAGNCKAVAPDQKTIASR